jgi:(p)ppGpp synthase/HD superfamily hydrolase
LSAALLHDVLEDCSHLVNSTTLSEQYAVAPQTVALVMALTKRKGGNDPAYWRVLAGNPQAIAVKLADRLHNILTLESAFALEKQTAKILETKTKVLSLVHAKSLRTSSLLPPSLTLCRAVALLLDALSPSSAAAYLRAQAG